MRMYRCWVPMLAPSRQNGSRPSATIYRYESDAIEMPASLLKPLADALDTVPDALMDWGRLPVDETERQDKMCEILPLITDGISIEGKNQKYILVKAPAHGGTLESKLRSALLTLYQFNHNGQDTKMLTLRILGELVSTRKRTTKDGQVFYEIRVSRGRGKSYLTTR